MTTQFVDNSGQRISLGRFIGKGGEGSVYEITGNQQFVAKIYHQPAKPEKAIKLAAMATIGKPEIMAFAAWPTATLHKTLKGDTWGLILPRIKDAREIHELYSPQHRKQHFPAADWRFLVRVARNCAVAFHALHHHGIVIGDVNQGNVFVSRQATVNLIDCDSFQIATNGRIFRCGVGVAHFVPPELQTARLADVDRSPNHDNFGLAILVFHLLLMGRHPFSGSYCGPGEMPIERAIREFRFAYGLSSSNFLMAPPPNSLTLSHLPQGISALFERAFARGAEATNGRPTAKEWTTALERLESGLNKCADDAGHFYPKHIASCPWCDIVSKGGPNFFISVTIQAVLGQGRQFDLVAIWAQIEAVPRPSKSLSTLSFFLDSKRFTPRPVPDERDDNRVLRHAVGVTVASSLLLMMFLSPFFRIWVFTVPVGVVFAIWWIVLKMRSPLQKIKRERASIYRNSRKELDATIEQRRDLTWRYERQFEEKMSLLQAAKKKHGELAARRYEELQALQQQVRQCQLDDFLKRQFISRASIPKIGPARVATLESYGIETAFDIELYTILAIPGFGEVMARNLMEWRMQVQGRFQFNSSKGVPQNAVQAVEYKFVQGRLQCESALQRGPRELRQITDAANAGVLKLNSLLPKMCEEVAQLRADLRVFEKIPWWY